MKIKKMLKRKTKTKTKTYKVFVNDCVSQVIYLRVKIEHVYDLMDKYEKLNVQSKLRKKTKNVWFYKNYFFVPLVTMVNNKFSIWNGRHRTCWLRQKGAKKIVIAIPNVDFAAFKILNMNYRIVNKIEIPN
ncbi:hypothetical protein RB151_030790 [Providencia rettgeri]|uniref:hypothetical protein n=1 Tax=Providencia rettgeri TaxID=587 RepID=UPI0008FAF49A|nr:hypothetical protein [Providencia rettgeri]APC12737.1 hypothetical protein RB151_030790 [Providencia rettgeri]